MNLVTKDGRVDRSQKKALFAENRHWVQPAVKVYPNGPQNEKERLWRLNRKEFIRSVIRGDGPKN